jgi:hypothetical protein
MSVARVDQQVVTAVFEQKLAAATTGCDGFTIAGHDRDREQSTAALASEVTYEGALRTEGEAVARVLDVGTHDDAAVGGERTGADRHV